MMKYHVRVNYFTTKIKELKRGRKNAQEAHKKPEKIKFFYEFLRIFAAKGHFVYWLRPAAVCKFTTSSYNFFTIPS
jgi:hypothetical protein